MAAQVCSALALHRCRFEFPSDCRLAGFASGPAGRALRAPVRALATRRAQGLHRAAVRRCLGDFASDYRAQHGHKRDERDALPSDHDSSVPFSSGG